MASERLEDGTYSTSLDLTTIGTPEKFKQILEVFDLTEHEKIKKNSIMGHEKTSFYWYTKEKDLFIKTEFNPLTHEFQDQGKKGYAGFMAIRGNKQEDVDTLLKVLMNRSEHVKGAGVGFSKIYDYEIQALDTQKMKIIEDQTMGLYHVNKIENGLLQIDESTNLEELKEKYPEAKAIN